MKETYLYIFSSIFQLILKLNLYILARAEAIDDMTFVLLSI